MIELSRKIKKDCILCYKEFKYKCLINKLRGILIDQAICPECFDY